MASRARGDHYSFFKIGEIREPVERDFEYFSSFAENHDEWTMKYDKDNIKVWMRETPHSPVKTLKVFGHFKSFSGRVLYDTLQDSEYRRTWDEAVLHDHTICTIAGVNSDINYYCMKCPPPLRNRDFVYQRCWRVTDTEYISFNHSIAHELFPPNKQYVRGVSFMTGYLIKELPKNEGCIGYFITQSDPRGIIPKWILNLIAGKIAPRVFGKIEKAALTYEEWKSKHNPDHRPWIYSSQLNEVPMVPISSLTHLTNSILLTSEEPALEEKTDLDEDSDEHLLSTYKLTIDPVITTNHEQEVASS